MQSYKTHCERETNQGLFMKSITYHNNSDQYRGYPITSEKDPFSVRNFSCIQLLRQYTDFSTNDASKLKVRAILCGILYMQAKSKRFRTQDIQVLFFETVFIHMDTQQRENDATRSISNCSKFVLRCPITTHRTSPLEIFLRSPPPLPLEIAYRKLFVFILNALPF